MSEDRAEILEDVATALELAAASLLAYTSSPEDVLGLAVLLIRASKTVPVAPGSGTPE